MIKNESNNPCIEQLRQLIKVTWDGDLISKYERDNLLKYGYVKKIHGFNFITEQGVIRLIEFGYLKP